MPGVTSKPPSCLEKELLLPSRDVVVRVVEHSQGPLTQPGLSSCTLKLFHVLNLSALTRELLLWVRLSSIIYNRYG